MRGQSQGWESRTGFHLPTQQERSRAWPLTLLSLQAPHSLSGPNSCFLLHPQHLCGQPGQSFCLFPLRSPSQTRLPLQPTPRSLGRLAPLMLPPLPRLSSALDKVPDLPSTLLATHSLLPDQPQMSFLLGKEPLDPQTGLRTPSNDSVTHVTISEHRVPLSFGNTLPYSVHSPPGAPSPQGRLPPPPVTGGPCTALAPALTSHLSPVPCVQAFFLAPSRCGPALLKSWTLGDQ